MQLFKGKRCELRAAILHVDAMKEYESVDYGLIGTYIIKVKVAQLCLTLCYPIDYTVHEIL